MTVVGKLRGTLYRRALEATASLYDPPPNDAERIAFQLERLNEVWARVLTNCAHFGELARKGGLPQRFGSIEEFADAVPPTQREDVQRQMAVMTDSSRVPDMIRMTGGSTSKPVQIPAWKSESVATRWEMWLGRGWYGVRPESRLFLLWGHSHLLGTGWKSWLRARRLELSDRLLGYRRYSAYDLSEAAMRRAGDALVEFRPDYVVGYSVALDLLARANEGREDLRDLGVKAVFATAEAFPDAASAERLHDLLGCPVGMEYGAVETGVMAHTHPAGGYRVFWRHHLLEAVGSGPRRRLVVTSLFPRAFPLIRYEIGDEVVLPEAAEACVGLTAFASVAGRCNDYVELSDGTLVHSEAFSHAVRPCSSIRGFQVVDHGNAVSIRFTSDEDLTSEERSGITARLARIHPQLGSARFERSESLEQTVAGKTRMIVQEPSPGYPAG